MAILMRSSIWCNQKVLWPKAKSRKSASCFDPFMDLSKPPGLGTYVLMRRSRHTVSSKMSMSLVYFVHIDDKKVVFLVLYVDDILLIGKDVEKLSNVKK